MLPSHIMTAWLPALVWLLAAGSTQAGSRAGQADYDKWLEVPVAQRCARMFANLGQAPRRLHLPSATVRFLDLTPSEPDPGPPWLLIPGYGGDLCSYGPMIALLAGRHRVLAFDLPGFGESASTDEHYHSLGGHVCIGAALTQPRHIATMTLIDTAGTFDTAEFVKQIAKQKGGVNLGQLSLKRGRGLVDLTLGEQEFMRRFVVSDPAIWTAVASFRANYHNQIGDIRTPTLILWGMDDPLFPVEGAAFLKENVPNSQLRILDGAGHCENESEPRVVVDLIEKLVRASEARSP
jgi:pimeloyl-ACP methyl ester carboxylesterase